MAARVVSARKLYRLLQGQVSTAVKSTTVAATSTGLSATSIAGGPFLRLPYARCSYSSVPGPAGEQEQRQIAWWLKAFMAAFAVYMGVSIVPYMGDGLVTQSVDLTKGRDPLFQRSGASRISMLATTDERRLKVANAGGLESLLALATKGVDVKARQEAVKALVALCSSEEVARRLQEIGGREKLARLAESCDDEDIKSQARTVLKRLPEAKRQH